MCFHNINLDMKLWLRETYFMVLQQVHKVLESSKRRKEFQVLMSRGNVIHKPNDILKRIDRLPPLLETNKNEVKQDILG